MYLANLCLHSSTLKLWSRTSSTVLKLEMQIDLVGEYMGGRNGSGSFCPKVTPEWHLMLTREFWLTWAVCGLEGYLTRQEGTRVSLLCDIRTKIAHGSLPLFHKPVGLHLNKIMVSKEKMPPLHAPCVHTINTFDLYQVLISISLILSLLFLSLFLF